MAVPQDSRDALVSADERGYGCRVFWEWYEWECPEEPIPRLGKELRACPFCGNHEAEVFCGEVGGGRVVGRPYFTAHVECQHDTCMAEVPGAMFDNPQEAIEAVIREWNERPVERALLRELNRYMVVADDEHIMRECLEEYAEKATDVLCELGGRPSNLCAALGIDYMEPKGMGNPEKALRGYLEVIANNDFEGLENY